MISIFALKKEARDDAYDYFNKNIRPLSKLSNGNVHHEALGLEDNNVDAYRHAYASGVFTQAFSEKTADILGRLNEFRPADLYSNSGNPGAENMDLWNNSVGRKYGKRAKNREELLKLLHKSPRDPQTGI